MWYNIIKVDYNISKGDVFVKVLDNMWKFTDTDVDISDSDVFKCMELAENGNYKEFKKLYKKLSKGSCGMDLLQYGRYKLMGYEFDFTPFLRRFLVRFKYDNDYKIRYALNKTNLFDNIYCTRSQVIDILEDTRHIVEFE